MSVAVYYIDTNTSENDIDDHSCKFSTDYLFPKSPNE